MVSLGLGWEDFLAWELLGFVFLVAGTFIYNEIVIVPIDIMSRNTKVENPKTPKPQNPIHMNLNIQIIIFLCLRGIAHQLLISFILFTFSTRHKVWVKKEMLLTPLAIANFTVSC